MTPKTTCRLCGKDKKISRHAGGVCSICRYYSEAAMPGEWVAQANCATTDPEVFWPEVADAKSIKRAQKICLACPVVAECLAYAVDTNQTQGIWGGLTPAARNAYAQLTEAV